MESDVTKPAYGLMTDTPDYARSGALPGQHETHLASLKAWMEALP